MNRILTLVKYDYLQRVRSYKFLIILCASIAFAASLIPAPDSIYSTISIGDYVGYNNSAWVAYVTAIMASVFISLFGYYIINNSIGLDQKTKMGQLVAATDITNFRYLLSKFLSNFAILFSILFCIFLVGIVLFFIRSKGYQFEILHFVTAYFLIPIPTLLFISALAITLEVLFKRKSALHNVIFFFLFSILLLQSKTGVQGDLFGTRYPTDQMEKQVDKIDNSQEQHSLNIGFVFRQRALENRFEYSSPEISYPFIIWRVIWAIFGLVVIALTSKFFHRFEISQRSHTSKSTPQLEVNLGTVGLQEMNHSSLPLLETSMSIWPVFKVEFKMILRKGKRWLWVLNLIGMILLIITPITIAHKFVLPVIWFLQVHRWADLVTKEKSNGMHYFVYSSFRPVHRLLSAQFLSGISVAVLLVSPLIVRYIILGQFIPVITIILGAIFIIAFSALVGITTGGKRLFEILFFFIVYLNVNSVPFIDYFGGLHNSTTYLATLSGVTLLLTGLSYSFRAMELRKV